MSGEIWSEKLPPIDSQAGIPLLKLLIGRKIKIDTVGGYFIPSEVVVAVTDHGARPLVVGKGYDGMSDSNSGTYTRATGPDKGKKVLGWFPSGLRIEILPDGATLREVDPVKDNALAYLYE